MSLCGKHAAEYMKWATTDQDFGASYNADRSYLVVNQDAMEIRALHATNRRELIGRQLASIKECCAAGRRCGTSEEAFT